MNPGAGAWWRDSPMLAPALVLAGGIWIARVAEIPRLGVVLLGALALVGGYRLAVRGALPLAVTAVALPLGLLCGMGLTAAQSKADAVFAGLDSRRVVRVEGRLSDYLVSSGDMRRTTVEVDRLTQGKRVEEFPLPLRLVVGGEWPEAAAALPGRRISVSGYLKATPRYFNFTRRAPPAASYAIYLKSAALLVIEPPASGNLFDWMRSANAATDARFDRLDTATGRRYSASLGVIKALVLGRRGELEETWAEVYRRGGIYHILAISGSHVVLLTYLLFALLSATRLPRRSLYGASLAGLIGFVAFIGWSPSVLRAALMGALFMAGRMLGRRGSAWNALGAAAFIILAIEPRELFDLGFQLTFMATAAILAWGPLLERGLRLLPRLLRKTIALSLAAQTGTLPLTLWAFNTAPVLAVVANALVLPIVAVVLLGGIALALAVWIPGPWAAALLVPLDATNRFVVAATAGLSADPLVVPTPAPAWVALFLISALALPILARRRIVATWILATGALVAALVIVVPPPSPALAGAELTLLDVGQGDALLLRWGRHAVLVDGGGGFSEGSHIGRNVVFPSLADAGVRRLDAIVLSHPHRDHGHGLADLAGMLPIGELWLSPRFEDNDVLVRLERRAAASGIRRRWLYAGDRLRLPGLVAEVLHPSLETYTVDPVNNGSLCLRLAVAGDSILCTGDIQLDTETNLLRSEKQSRHGAVAPFSLAAGILKVAHHGSKTSTSPEFVAAVRPRLALASMGRGNSFGHPAAATLATLAAAGVPLWRTDRCGAVRLRIENGRIQVTSAISKGASRRLPLASSFDGEPAARLQSSRQPLP